MFFEKAIHTLPLTHSNAISPRLFFPKELNWTVCCVIHTHTHHLKLISNLIIPLLYWARWSPSGQHHSHFSPVGNTTSSGAHTHTYTPTIFQHLHKYTRCKVAKAKTNTLNLFLKAWPQQTCTHIYKHTVSPQCFTFTFHSITTHAMEKNTHGE